MKYFLFISLLSFFGPAFAAGDAGDISVKVANGDMLLSYKGRSVSLGVDVGAEKESTTNILFRAIKGSRFYVVIDDERPSNPDSPEGMCGAGYEASLIWISAAEDLSALNKSVILYDSCYKSISLDDSQIGSSTLSTTFIDYDTNEKTVLEYDNKFPERGFQLTVKKLEPKRKKLGKS